MPIIHQEVLGSATTVLSPPNRWSTGRPNPIGMSVVCLLGRDGERLRVADVDILDDTPLLHNFVDGVVIAGAFINSTQLGLAVALPTIAHEVPQEVGEFMVCLRSGFTRRRALFLEAMTSLTSVVSAVLGYFFLSQMHGIDPYLLNFAAAGFLYVALADLVPSQRGRMSLKLTILDLLLVASGIGVIALFAHGH